MDDQRGGADETVRRRVLEGVSSDRYPGSSSFHRAFHQIEDRTIVGL
jgi:hypothetical protein